MDELAQGIPHSEMLLVGEDIYSHVDKHSTGQEVVHGNYIWSTDEMEI